MKILSVKDDAFAQYGKVVEGIAFDELLQALNTISDKPADSTIYEPGDANLEKLPTTALLRQNVYGGMPIQVGYCNGSNRILNCLEYHRGCEVNIAANDVVLLVASAQKIVDNQLNTQEVEAFLLPAGQAVLLYETTLHYAPCNAPGEDGFRVAIVLPQETNTEKPQIDIKNDEDKLLWAHNKWLLAHPASPEAKQGAFVGLVGENITV